MLSNPLAKTDVVSAGKGRGEDGAAKDIRLLAVTLERCEGSVALLSALRRLTWNLEVVGSSICDAQTETDLVGLVGQAACDVECSFGMGSSDIAKIVELNDEVMLLKNAAVTRGGQELYVMELKKEIQVLRLRLKEGLHSQERVGNLELQVSELWLSRQELASCRELVVELEREVEGLRRKDVGGADNGASAACARVTELEREMMDLQRHCANLEQQRDRAVSDGSVQVQCTFFCRVRCGLAWRAIPHHSFLILLEMLIWRSGVSPHLCNPEIV